MPDLPDIPTLRLCSMLASLAFFGVFVGLWAGRRDEPYFLHWAGGSLGYALVILAFDFSGHTPLQDGLLYALLCAGTLAVLTGVRRFDGLPPFRPRLLLPMLASGLGYALPAFGTDSAAARIGGTCGSALATAIVGGTLAFGRAPAASRGGGSPGRRSWPASRVSSRRSRRRPSAPRAWTWRR